MTIPPIHSKTVDKLRNAISKVIPKEFILLQESPISIQNSEPKLSVRIPHTETEINLNEIL